MYQKLVESSFEWCVRCNVWVVVFASVKSFFSQDAAALFLLLCTVRVNVVWTVDICSCFKYTANVYLTDCECVDWIVSIMCKRTVWWSNWFCLIWSWMTPCDRMVENWNCVENPPLRLEEKSVCDRERENVGESVGGGGGGWSCLKPNTMQNTSTRHKSMIFAVYCFSLIIHIQTYSPSATASLSVWQNGSVTVVS